MDASIQQISTDRAQGGSGVSYVVPAIVPFPVAVAVDPFPSEQAHNYRLRSYRTRSPIQQAVRGIVELSLSVPTIVTYKVEKNPLQADTSLAVSSTSIVPKILLRSKRPPNLQSF